ncbi:MAG: hypothetical protein JW715_12010 [Sedimentisphaerales bacterium]|nr:hypothetical protein [Sedimentisphaerales bacterium]
MFDLWYREHLEDQAKTEITKILPRLEYKRRTSIAHYFFSFLVAVIAFVILFVTHISSPYNEDLKYYILTFGIILSGVLVIVSQFLKRNSNFIRYLIHVHGNASNYIKKRTFMDPLYWHFFTILLILCIPLLLLFVMTIITWNGNSEIWVTVGSESHNLHVESIKQFSSLILAIVSAQLAIFTFMFSYLLGRYSSQIVKSLMTHHTVLLLWAFSIAVLLLLWIFYLYGYPYLIEDYINPIFITIIIFSLIMTIWVCVSGIHPEKAVLYAGKKFARKTRKHVKKSTLVLEKKFSKFWAVFNWAGLDWRETERFKLYEPPSKGLPFVMGYLSNLFNAAYKAVEENQQDLVHNSLIAILNVLKTYIENRKTYYGSRDNVLNETNDQMAALLKATCNSPNEHMSTLVIRCIGNIGLYSLQIEERPSVEVPNLLYGPPPKRHEISLLWTGLLKEAFELTHKLQRTTAPYEAIDQLKLMGIISHNNEYFETMATTFFSNIMNIHTTSVNNKDEYHRLLGQKCIEAIMYIFALTSQDSRTYNCSIDFRPFNQCVHSLKRMAQGQFLIDKNNFTFEGFGNILTSKTKESQIILQDIFYLIMEQNVSEDRQKSIVINDLENLIDLVAEFAKIGISQGAVDCGMFINAFYEIAYLIIRKSPESMKKYECERKSDIPVLYERPSTQDQKEAKIFTVWRDLFSVFFDKRIIGLDWEQKMCAILGIGFTNINIRESELLKNQLLECIDLLRNRVIKTQIENNRNVDHWWPYLQLLGAWVSEFVKESKISIEIASEVGKLKPFHSYLHGYSGQSKFEAYGYPSVFHGDFFIPRMNNLMTQGYITEKDIKQIICWQEMLMNEDLLISYHKEIEKTRSPLREQYYKELREKKKERNKDNQTEEN